MANNDEAEFGTSQPPRKSDMLFGAETDWKSKLCAASGVDDIIYQDGYRQAALHLVNYICEKGGKHDVVYPIIYLYRHHIELVLKSIIRTACFLLEREIPSEIRNTHELSKLWVLTRPLLDPVCKLVDDGDCYPTEDLEGIDSYINQLHVHDPDSQRFRYPETKKGMPSLRRGLLRINVRDLSNALEKLVDYLEMTNDWFGDLIEAKAQYQMKHGLTPPHHTRRPV
ncbi:MAG: hypothetical protein WCC64_21510 [Aliidongia sp.]